MEVRPVPYPGDTRARGWRFELDLEKAKQSDTWLRAKTGEIRGALLLLWSESWQQNPCGSLPADDELVALIIDMPAAKFQRHRHILMRGWWTAEDGRLYHDVIVERVLAMLDKRMTDAQRAANYRARRSASGVDPSGVTSESRVTNGGLRSEFDTKHQAPDNQNQVGNTPLKPPRKRRGPAAAQQTVSVDQLVSEGVQQQHAEDWLTVRAKKSLPLTPTAWDDVKAQAAEAGLSLDDAIRTAAVNGWGGFKAKWLRETAPQGTAAVGGMNKQEALEASNDAVVQRLLAKERANAGS